MEKDLRFKSLSWYKGKFEPKTIIIGGQGGIGSYFSFLASRVVSSKTKLLAYDFDKVEIHNIGGQLFSNLDIGKLKANAMNEFTKNYGLVPVMPVNSKFDMSSMKSNVMVSCFDNMSARKAMFEAWKLVKSDKKLYIDGRLLAENYEVFFVTPENIDRYEKTLFDDSEVLDVPCSAKQTSHYAASIAADMIKGYTNWIGNINGDVRELPFRIHEIGELFIKNIEL